MGELYPNKTLSSLLDESERRKSEKERERERNLVRGRGTFEGRKEVEVSQDGEKVAGMQTSNIHSSLWEVSITIQPHPMTSNDI